MDSRAALRVVHEYEYRQSIDYLLQQIVIESSDEKVEKIQKIRQTLYAADPALLSQTHSHNMTVGKYDKEKQIDLLLNYDARICATLKNMTLSMDGKWIGMEQYC